MSSSIDKVQLQNELDQDQTLQNIRKVESALDDETKALKKFAQGTEEYFAQLKKVEDAQKIYQDLAANIAIVNMPMQMLIKKQSELNEQLFNTPSGVKGFQQYKDELDLVNRRMTTLKDTASNTVSSLNKTPETMIKYVSASAHFFQTLGNAFDRAKAAWNMNFFLQNRIKEGFKTQSKTNTPNTSNGRNNPLTTNNDEDELKKLEANRDKKLKINEDAYNQEKANLAKHLAERTYTQEQYDERLEVLEVTYKKGKSDLLEQYSKDLKDSTIKDADVRNKAIEDAKAVAVKADTDLSLELAKQGKEKLDKEKEQQDKLQQIKKELGVDKDKGNIESQKELWKVLYDAGIISEKKYLKEKENLNIKAAGKHKFTWKDAYDFTQNVSKMASDFAKNMSQAETIASDAKYDREIKIAKQAGKDTTKLEEQKQEAQHKIKKKYADLQFAASILQIGSSTAVAAMEAYKAMAGIFIFGPALGIAAAAAVVLAGAAQMKVAKANRDAAKGLFDGGYSGDYSNGGYTPAVDSHQVGGYIPVHGNEFVGNHEAVENPHVNRFFRIINLAQKNGTIRMLDTTAILSQLQLGGKYQGGYTNSKQSDAVAVQGNSGNNSTMDGQLSKVVDLLTIISSKKIVLSMTDVRDGLNDLKAYEANASR